MGLISFIAKKILDMDDVDVDDFDDFDDAFEDNAEEWDSLGPSEDEINDLMEQAAQSADIDADPHDAEELSFTGRKICATRHGCTGTTNCDSSYGAPIGR